MNAVKIIFMAILLITVTACTASPSPTDPPLPVVPEAPVATTAPVASDTPEPPPTPTIQPTETPTGFIFRDDFSGVFQSGWTWKDENKARWGFRENGWLEILGEDSHLASGVQSNLLCRQPPAGDFQVTIHLSADPTQNYQQATLYLYQDSVNYIAINRGYCAHCVSGGGAVYMDYNLGGSWGAYNAPTRDTDLWLRLVIQGETVKGDYAFEEGAWQHLGSVGNFFAKTEACIGVSNVDSGGIDADLIGKFDYFEFTLP
jgi:beta-xylosidase